MNEELKIVIKAVTGSAKKGIEGVKKELEGVKGESGKASKGMGAAFKGIAKGAAIAVAAIAAIGAALIALGKKSLEFNRAQAKLNAAFMANGSSADQAAASYNRLYRFLGDIDKSVEASSHIAKMTNDMKAQSEWGTILQGVYAQFGDSLPTEGLAEAANETARVGKVTGNLADALNWAGVSEDAMNAKLAKTNSLSEREAVIRETLNGLYSDAAALYEKNNKDILEYNESQARVDESMGRAGRAVYPLMTALNNLSASLLDALKPALDVIIPALSTFINWITQGIQSVLAFFGVITGKSAAVSTMGQIGDAAGNAANNAGNLASGFEDVAASAEKAKRATMGFDELNVVSSGSSSGSSGSSGPAYVGGSLLGNGAFSADVEEGEQKASGFAQVMQDVAAKLKDVFAPTVTAWTSAFDTIKASWEDTKPRFVNGATDIMDSFKSAGSYLVETFVPDVVNSFSTNLAPVFADYLSVVIDQAGKDFEAYGAIVKDATDSIIIPAVDTIKTTITDTFDIIGAKWEEKGQPLVDSVTQALDHVRSVVVRLYEQFIKPIADKIIQVFQQLWEQHLKPLVEEIVDAAMEIGQCLLDLYNKFIAPIIEWIMANVVPVVRKWFEKLIEHFGTVLGYISDAISGVIRVLKGLVQFITGIFTGDWEKAWEGIKNIFGGIWDVIVGIALAAWEAIKYPFEEAGEFFGDIWEVIKKAFNDTKEWFKEKFEGAWSNISGAFKSAGSWAKERWTDIKNGFASVGSWFKEKFDDAYGKATGAFKNAKTGFSNVWTNIKTSFGDIPGWFKEKFSAAWTKVKEVFSSGGKVFDGIKDGILEGLKTVINKLIDGINKVIKKPFDGINSALRTIRDINILGVEPFKWISTISIPQIPKLAKGGVVDEATLALIGERGKEAVVPLENNTEWMDRFIDKLISRSNGNQTFIFQVGETEFARAAVRGINNLTRQTGVNPLLI